MYRGTTVGVVVPAYNEAGFVGDVIETVPAFVDRVYAVDDDSDDDTWAEIRAAASRVNDDAARDATPAGASQAPRDGAPAPDGDPATDGGPSSDGAAPSDGGPTSDADPAPDGGATNEVDGGALTGGTDSLEGDDTIRGRDPDAAAESAAGEAGALGPPRVVTIRHERNRGVGGAIKTGYRRALADGIEVVAVMNGDGQMDPDVLDRIVDPVVDGEADYAKGDRLRRAEDRRAMSGWRLFGNALLTLLTRFASGYWRMSDPQNGYTAISRETLAALDLDELHDRYGFCNDVLIRLSARGLRVADVPMKAVYGDEDSHIRYPSFVPTLSLLLLTGFLRRLWRAYVDDGIHPVAALYPAGALGFLGGALVLALAAGGFAGEGANVGLPVLVVGGVALALSAGLDARRNSDLEAHR